MAETQMTLVEVKCRLCTGGSCVACDWGMVCPECGLAHPLGITRCDICDTPTKLVGKLRENARTVRREYKRVFEKYIRSRNPRERQANGVLLSVVKKQAEQHGVWLGW